MDKTKNIKTIEISGKEFQYLMTNVGLSRWLREKHKLKFVQIGAWLQDDPVINSAEMIVEGINNALEANGNVRSYTIDQIDVLIGSDMKATESMVEFIMVAHLGADEEQLREAKNQAAQEMTDQESPTTED